MAANDRHPGLVAWLLPGLVAGLLLGACAAQDDVTGSGGSAGWGNGGSAGWGNGGSAGNGSDGGLGGFDPGDSGSPSCTLDGCGAGEYCAVSHYSCALTESCQPRPSSCDSSYSPACGCDGQTYDNECRAHLAGFDLDDSNPCEPPAGYFACGRWFCSSAAEYCYAESFTLYHSCEPLPPCSPPPDCSCLSEVGCLCTQADGGGLTVICSGA